MAYFFLWFRRFEGVMEVHYDRKAVEEEKKRGHKKIMETIQDRFKNLWKKCLSVTWSFTVESSIFAS